MGTATSSPDDVVDAGQVSGIPEFPLLEARCPSLSVDPWRGLVVDAVVPE